MFSGFIFTSNNFRKPCLKRESSSTLLTQSKTHIQAHLSQAPASLDRATPRSKTHLQAYLQTISRKKKNRTKSKKREQSRQDRAHHNPRSHHRIQPQYAPPPQIAPPHPIPERTTAPNPRSHYFVAPQHLQDRTHDPPMPDLSLSRSTSPFPLIVDYSLFLTLSSSLSLRFTEFLSSMNVLF